MIPESNLSLLIKLMQPYHNPGLFVFCKVAELDIQQIKNAIMMFKEAEGYTLIMSKNHADDAGLQYDFVASWITLNVYSSLESVGLTAAFSGALAGEGISCNVVAAYHHDHIFVSENDVSKAMQTLQNLVNT